MTTERIQILKDILLDLHQGASPESVQERFNQHFTGVSALEISLMEHELMSGDTGITFEDVMKLCNIHANLFKGVIADVTVADVEKEGHPVYVFKQENLALRAALLRVRRILDTYANTTDPDLQKDLSKGLQHQLGLLGQFERHYDRKENLFFSAMERYGHVAPPKVMWGVDDEIRTLFQQVIATCQDLTPETIPLALTHFDTFAKEFEEMIFKEEAILLMILLETLTQDDWLEIAEESDTYGYAIIKPTAKWVPDRRDFSSETNSTQTKISAKEEPGTQTTTLDTPQGQFTISFTPKEPMTSSAMSSDSQQPFGKGYLSIKEANLILNHLPMELTFVNKDDIFQYFNDAVPAEEMIFKRTKSQIGRHVDLCHPPKILERVRAIFDVLRSGKKSQVDMWFKSDKTDKFVYVVYKAVRDEQGDFQGVLEYVQDIQPFFELETDMKRDLDE